MNSETPNISSLGINKNNNNNGCKNNNINCNKKRWNNKEENKLNMVHSYLTSVKGLKGKILWQTVANEMNNIRSISAYKARFLKIQANKSKIINIKKENNNNNENNMEHIFKKVKDTLKRNRNNYNESSTDTSDDVIISKPIKKKRRKNINNDNTHDIRKIKNRQSALLSREKRKKQLKYLDKKIPVLKKLNKIDLPYLVKKSENVDTGCIDEDYDLNMKRNNNKCVNEMKELRDILNKAEFDENELECIIKHEIRDRFDINIDYMSENSTDDNNDDNNNNNSKDNNFNYVQTMNTKADKQGIYTLTHKISAHNTYILNCKLSPDNRYLASCSSDGTIVIFDVYNNFKKKVLKGHTKWVWDMAFSADSAYLVSASSDKTAKLWDLKTGQYIIQYEDHNKGVTCVALNDSAAQTTN